jgi:hypothetical protein
MKSKKVKLKPRAPKMRSIFINWYESNLYGAAFGSAHETKTQALANLGTAGKNYKAEIPSKKSKVSK